MNNTNTINTSEQALAAADALRTECERVSEGLHVLPKRKMLAFAVQAKVDAESAYLACKIKRGVYEEVRMYANSLLNISQSMERAGKSE